MARVASFASGACPPLARRPLPPCPLARSLAERASELTRFGMKLIFLPPDLTPSSHSTHPASAYRPQHTSPPFTMTRNHARRTDARARDAAARSPHATSPSPSLAPSVVPGPSGSNYALVEESDSDEYDAGPSSSKKRKPRKAKGKAAKKGKVEDDDKEWEEVWVDLGEDQEESDGDDDRVDENEPGTPYTSHHAQEVLLSSHELSPAL